ncbi:glycerol-3-phosphate ABC transporter ATP-binding protein [candidate division WOR-3 bacterium JGI_Cruoil_03_51_56]|uniref:Glycerol-3-phosphate ABC transporter ATP-binding protein n=1 Tax=candidate division WOR-3 bacterium JGI_Cruoil_03_51_56 TaxID=1973747 RepID=A0A235BMW6_UNCW3|nr:MAG: glycerol-3-phosphate ABC transporter ATP-binding protein [candidate division WOR-3 bacterium JGI_Cruoil_03_51_56]
MSRVLFKDLTKVFDKNVMAVDHVSFEVADKEFFVLVGPSGCGKSTTLRLVAGLEEATSGQIFIGDRLVNNVEPKDRDIAMVFQNYALYPHMTVYDNMAFALKLRKSPKKQTRQRVEEAAQILGIGELLGRKPAALSGGQRQRVAVGRAIVRNPKVFLFDEPLSNLDAKLRVGMRAELAQLHHRLETTVFYVTHDQVEAMTLGQRIGVMKNGRLLQIADPMTLYNKPVNRFVAGFIGSPPMNFLEGRIETEPLRFVQETFTLNLPESLVKQLAPAQGKKVTLGIRPENILPSDGIGQNQGIKVWVEVAELMGNENILHLKIGQNVIVARVQAHYAPKTGEILNIQFNTDKLHFFDPENEATLV